ncbi:MAG: hypothetical protein ACM3KE_18505 [Hyphomicrobiales bacterium]
MQVSTYQMHSMLECYSKKLSRANTRGKSAEGSPKGTAGEAVWSPESSRQVTMENISRQVLDKVTDVVALSRSRGKTTSESPEPDRHAPEANEPPAAEFTFNVIDSVNRKRISRLAVGEPAALIRRLDQMAEKAPISKTESWV